MPERDVPLQKFEIPLMEDLRDQAHVAVDQDLLAVAGSDTRGLLSTMLQSVEPEVGEFGDFLAWRPDSEYSASILRSAVQGVNFVR